MSFWTVSECLCLTFQRGKLLEPHITGKGTNCDHFTEVDPTNTRSSNIANPNVLSMISQLNHICTLHQLQLVTLDSHINNPDASLCADPTRNLPV